MLILISSNKGAEVNVGDTMVVRAATVNFTGFKGSIEIKEGPRAVSSFTFQGMVIPGSIEVVVNKGDTGVIKIGRNYFSFFFGEGSGRCVHTRSFRSLVTVQLLSVHG